MRPPGRITSFPGDTPATTTDGAFLTTAKAFSQPGSSSVLGFSGGPSILRINATGDAESPSIPSPDCKDQTPG